MYNEIEALASELKALVGYGAKAHHVIARPHLVALIEAQHPDLATRALGQAIIDHLRQAADRLDEADGEAVRELLMLSRKYHHLNAVVRREDAIRRLRAGVNVETWRRPDGLELELMRSLARVLLQPVAA